MKEVVDVGMGALQVAPTKLGEQAQRPPAQIPSLLQVMPEQGSQGLQGRLSERRGQGGEGEEGLSIPTMLGTRVRVCRPTAQEWTLEEHWDHSLQPDTVQ